MARKDLKRGNYPNDPNADSIYDAIGKINEMLKEIYPELDATAEGIEPYETKADMDAVTPGSGNPKIAIVMNDSTASNNGYYRYDSGSGSWVKRDEFYASSLDPTDSVEAVTGKAVGDYTVKKGKSDSHFIRKYSGDVNSEITTGVTYAEFYESFKSFKLVGFDPSGEYKISFFWRNAGTNNDTHRIIISENQSGTWTRVFDQQTTTLTENASGYTFVEFTQGSKIVRFEFDYSVLSSTFQESIGSESADPPYVINSENSVFKNENAQRAASLKAFRKFANSNNGLYGRIVGEEDWRTIDIIEAIKAFQIFGSDPDADYKLRYIARNHSTQGYRIIIGRYDAGSWTTVIETQSYPVTENNGGLIKVSISESDNQGGESGVSAELLIDYDQIPDGFGKNLWTGSGNVDTDGQNTPEYSLVTTASQFSLPQPLSKDDSPEFKDLKVASLTVTAPIPTGTLSNPPTGLSVGDHWADTTDSTDHPIIRIAQVET